MVDEPSTEYLSSTSAQKKTCETGNEVKQLILDDIDEEGGVWFKVRFFLRVVEPFFKLVRIADGMTPQKAQLHCRLNIVFKDLKEALRTQPELAAVMCRLEPILQVSEYRRTYTPRFMVLLSLCTLSTTARMPARWTTAGPSWTYGP